MRHRHKVNCSSCPRAQAFLKLQPNSTTNSPSSGFAIADNPEHISKAHSEFDFSPADAASKRNHHLSMWGRLWLPGWAATAPQSPHSLGRAGSSSALSSSLGAGRNQNRLLAKGTPAHRQAPDEASALEVFPFELGKDGVYGQLFLNFSFQIPVKASTNFRWCHA